MFEIVMGIDDFRIQLVKYCIHSATDDCTSPGKQPIPSGWQRREKPYTEETIESKFNNDKNIGFLCGARSDLTGIDVDWNLKGIWDNIFHGIDTSGFVKVSHTEEKYHLLFKYCKELKAGQYKAFGFDILSDDPKIDPITKKEYVAGNNCVCAPSLHKDGNKYQITGNIEDRPEIPEIVLEKLNKLIACHNHIKKDVLPKCRAWYRDMWKALFELKDDDLHHKTNIFYGDIEGRNRCLHFFAELKVNGADDQDMFFICAVLFGERFDFKKASNELKNVNDKPATTETVKADPYFSRFYKETSRGRPKKDFDELIENAAEYWNCILNAETPKECKSLPILTRLNKLKKFISNDLHQMPEDFWRAFVENDVLLAFGLNKKDARAVIDACEKTRNEVSVDDSKGEDSVDDSTTNGSSLPPLEDRLNAYPEHIKKKANDILDNRDPFKFICDTWNELHVGDRSLGEMLACSVASTQVLNLAVGIHEKPSGESESGKSDACSKMGKLCPVWKFRSTMFSPKVLYYMTDLLPGTIIYTDDVDLNAPGVMSTIKKVTGEFEDQTISDTIIDGKAVNMVIPPRINFWMSSVDPIGEKQLGTRFVYSNTEAGTEHDREVNHKQRGKALGKPLEDDNEKILICRCMFEYICDQLHYVFSPYLFASTWSKESEKRNLEKFTSVLFSITVFKYRQRETLHDNLVGTFEDWNRAISIYSPVAQNNSCLLTDEEISILYSIHEMSEAYDDGVPHKRLLNYMKEKDRFSKSDSTLKRILIGDVGSGKQGFKEKVPGFSYETISKPKLDEKGLEIKGSGYTKTLCYNYEGVLFDGIPKGADIIETIKKGTFVNCDSYAAEGVEKLFRDDPVKAHALKKDTATFENWKGNLRNQKGFSEIIRNHQNSKPLNSENIGQPLTIDNSIVYNNNLRNQESSNNGVGGISVCVLEGEIDEDTHAKLRGGSYPEKSANSLNSEPPNGDHGFEFRGILMNSETPNLISESADNGNTLNSEEPQAVDNKVYLIPLLRQALVKLAKTEYHSTVLDIDEFTRNFNSRTPEYKKGLGSFVVENEARKLNIVGWR